MWFTDYIYITRSTLIFYEKNIWYERLLDTDCQDTSLIDIIDPIKNDYKKILLDTYSSRHGKADLDCVNLTCSSSCANLKSPNSDLQQNTKSNYVTGLFYFNVPSDRSGGITFYKNRDEKFFTYYPDNYDFLIFPNFLLYKHEQVSSEEYRIIININCEGA